MEHPCRRLSPGHDLSISTASVTRMLLLFVFLGGAGAFSYSQIVINEIHYDPDIQTEKVEFIELYNTSTTDADLSGWSIGKGVEYTFPENTTLSANAYLVVAQHPASLTKKYKTSRTLVYGPFQGRLNNEHETIELLDAQDQLKDRVEYRLGFPWPTVGNPIPAHRAGTSQSIQLVNPAFDNDLGGSWRSASPTPGQENSVFSENSPPQIRQVKHVPKQPVSNQEVLITAKVTDPDGINQVTLSYQIVDPGKYIRLTDSDYEKNWITTDMNDSGLDGDLIAGDQIYSLRLPGDLQQHRRLIRYRITVSDLLGMFVTLPYADDPQPNFAYFTYDGVPDWTGAVRPGETEEVTYPSDMLGSIPVYHLITSKEETERCTWLDQRRDNDYHYLGTIVYDGEVYDHVWFRARGGVWRFSMGKNMWKFNFPRGHAFQAKDNYGKKYDVKWDKLNLGACIQQGDFLHRGEQGMFESVGFQLFRMAGVESSHTHFVHFRIIDEEHEEGRLNEAHPPLTESGTQYDGDFWGLYLATEQVDGRFLDEHGLPDGNLYKMESGFGELRNQSPDGVSDSSDLRDFINGYQRRPTIDWWREHIDFDRYFNYRVIVEGIHHYDIANGKNYYYYLNPETNQWSQIPWDLDLTWADNMFGQGDDPFRQAGIFRLKEVELAFQNRAREVIDLLFNPDQTGQLIDEISSFIYTPDQLSFVDADRAMWDYHWVMDNRSQRYGYKNNTQKSGQGKFYQIARSKDFAGMLEKMKLYIPRRISTIEKRYMRNAEPPDTPVIRLVSNKGFQVDALTFETSEFHSPNPDNTFAAMQWRIAEVEPFAQTGKVDPTKRILSLRPAKPLKYEIDPVWESDELTVFQKTMTIPSHRVIAGRTYRVRVKMKDSSGQWSHWSDPIQFQAEESQTTRNVRDHLRITEVMYHPRQGEEFEFLELKNVHPSETLDISGMAFTNGIDFTFPPGTTIPPTQFLLLTRIDSPVAQADFLDHYALKSTQHIVGPYRGKLSNAGERITLKTSPNGIEILSFEYNDGRGWPVAADGAGHSLVPVSGALQRQNDGMLDYPGHWRASSFINGSPGRDDPEPIRNLVVNEFLANSLDADNRSNDWIELFNTSDDGISLANWYLSDDADELRKWPIPALPISPHGFISFDEEKFFNNPAGSGFALNKNGEEILLSYLPGVPGVDRVVDAVRFKAQEAGLTQGRYRDGEAYFFSMTPTRDQLNLPGEATVVMDEIMYHPPDNADLPEAGQILEYVELYNPLEQAITLSANGETWRLAGGIDYIIPAGTTLPPQGRLLVVPFDPSRPDPIDSFTESYSSMHPSVKILGPYQGRLSNRTDRISLEKSLDVDPVDGSIAWAVVDEVIYFDQSPWPVEPDGGGSSLQRINTGLSGMDPLNWQAHSPTPGGEGTPDTMIPSWMMH